MNKSVAVDLHVGDFAPVQGFKLLTLEEWQKLDFDIPLTDAEGRSSTVYIKL